MVSFRCSEFVPMERLDAMSGINDDKQLHAIMVLVSSDDFRIHMRARIQSAPGKRAIHELLALLAEGALRTMEPDTGQVLETKAGREEFREVCPDVIRAYLEALCNTHPQE
jgi:hypothetical protein